MGRTTLAIYKRHSADWVEVPGAKLPSPGDDLTRAPDEPPTWRTLKTPSEAELAAVLRRMIATVVVSDPAVTRREEQLREVLHIMLVKLESDAQASRSSNRDEPVMFRLYGSEADRIAVTAKRVRDEYAEYFARQRTRIFLPHDRDTLQLSDQTIYAVVAELWPYRVLGDSIDVLSKAFQTSSAPRP